MRPKTKPSIERQESHRTTENRTSTAADGDAPASNCDVTNETSDTETLVTEPVKIMLPCNYESKEGNRPLLEPIRLENKAIPIDMRKLLSEKLMRENDDETVRASKLIIELAKCENLRILGHETSRRRVTFRVIPPNSNKTVERATDTEVKKIDAMVMFDYVYRLSKERPRVWRYMQNRSKIARELMSEGLSKEWHRAETS